MATFGTTHVAETAVYWREFGPRNGPTLVFCHGMGLSHDDLIPLAEAMARDWRVVMWDMPGHGRSGPLPVPCDLDAFVDALESVLKDRGIAQPVLVGFSFGGMVAQSLLRRRSHPIAAMVAYGCYAPFLMSAPAPPELVDALAASTLVAPWSDIRASFAQACCLDPHGQAALLPAIERVGAQGLAAMTQALFGAFEADPKFRIAVPMLVLRGALDVNGAALVTSADALMAAGAEARQIVIEGAGHAAHLDKPNEVGRALANFLATLSVSGAVKASPE